MLRVICLAHDVGGTLGDARETYVESVLFAFAEEKGITYKGMPPLKVLRQMRANGILDETDITEEELVRVVEIIDHQSNSIRILERLGISLPEEVRFIIARHNDALTEEELLGLSDLARRLFTCFMMADSLEKGNNFLKHSNEEGEQLKEFESPGDFVSFIKGTPEKEGKMQGRTSIQDLIDVMAEMVIRGDLEEEVNAISRKPIENTGFGEDIKIRKRISEAIGALPDRYIKDQMQVSGSENSLEKMLSDMLGRAICVEGSAFLFSEKTVFDHGLGVFLPKLASAGIRIGVIARDDKQRKTIDELNLMIKGENKIMYAGSVVELMAEVPGAARFYYFKVREDPREDLDLEGLTVQDITNAIKDMIDSIGRVCGVEIKMLEKLHDAAMRFARAA